MINRKVKPVLLNKLSINNGFWKNYMELLTQQIIPYQWEALNDRVKGAVESGCIRNFRIAAGMENGEYTGVLCQDSDLYKWIEAAAYSLIWHPDKGLEVRIDSAVELIRSAQQPDGYLYTYYIINNITDHFNNLIVHNELYCLAHLIEGATAYYLATGKRTLLDVAIRFLECVMNKIGIGEGKVAGYPGHPGIEMALMFLYETTKEERFMSMAKYFVDQRGQRPLFFEECKRHGCSGTYSNNFFTLDYYQADLPVRQQQKVKGHAVRAVYLYSGMADVAAATNDKELFEACKRLWDNMADCQMYITGGIGSSEFGESFTFDYDLPNDTNYAETCASIGLIFFARRMFEITGQSKYIDVMEQALYNGVISGVGSDGKSYFYVNPLEVVPEASMKDNNKKHINVQRQKWFNCACCPPNIARLLASLAKYAYGISDNTFYINLFVGGNIEVEFGGQKSTICVLTEYPWNGNIKISVLNNQDMDFNIAIRIPRWCKTYHYSINCREYEPGKIKNGYLCIDRTWKNNDVVELDLEMRVKIMSASPNVREDIGKVSIMRGPLVYCLEEADNGKYLHHLYLSEQPDFVCQYEKFNFGEVVTINANGKSLCDDEKEASLYREYKGKFFIDRKLKFIPYYCWSNRDPGEMIVWVNI